MSAKSSAAACRRTAREKGGNMEANFICEFPLTEKLLANRFRKYNSTRCVMVMVIGIVAFAVIVCCGIEDIASNGFSLYWRVMTPCACAILLYGIFWPNIAAKAQLRRYRRETGSDQYRVSFGETIEIQEGPIRITWDYADITCVARWQYTFELQKSRALAIMLKPDGFTKGSFGEWKAFLREKRPDLTIPE